MSTFLDPPPLTSEEKAGLSRVADLPDFDLMALKAAVPAVYRQFISSLVVTNDGLTELATTTGYVWALTDQDGRAALGVRPDGTTVIGKFEIVNGAITLDALGEDIQPHLLQTLPQTSGYAWALTDEAGHVALGVRLDGEVVGNVATPDGSITLRKAAPDLAEVLMQTQPLSSGWALAVVDQDNRLAGGWRPDGTFEAILSSAQEGSLALDSSPISDGTYLVEPYVDVDGFRQIRSHRLTDGAAFRIGPAGVDNIDPRLTSDAVLYRTRTATGWESRSAPREGGTAVPAIGPRWAGIGTSMMAADTAAGGTLARLAVDLALPYSTDEFTPAEAKVVNLGAGGMNSKAICARMGARRAALTVTGGSIPTSGGVTVTVPGTTESGASLHQRIFSVWPSVTGTLAGVRGTLSSSQDPTTPVATFTRSVAGSAVAVAAGTPFICDLEAMYAGDKQIHWNFRNNLILAEVQADMPLLIARMTAYHKQFLILSELNGGGEDAINNWLASTYPNSYVDMKAWLIANGLAAAGITPTTQDTADIAANTVPTSLRLDSTHLNAIGHQVAGDHLATVVRQKGWAS